MKIEGNASVIGMNARSRSHAKLTLADSREITEDSMVGNNDLQRKQSQADIVRRQSSTRKRDIPMY